MSQRAVSAPVGHSLIKFAFQWRIQHSPEGFVFLPKRSDDLFSRYTLDAHIRFKLNSSKPVSPHQIQPPPYKNCSKNFFVSERGSSEPNEPPGSAPAFAVFVSTVAIRQRLQIWQETYNGPVSYTHLTLPTKRIV